MTDVKIRELDWYLRDHLFRQSNKGRQEFEQRMLPSEMIKTYLRYRNDDIDQISLLVDIVVGNLLHQHVINKKDGDSFEGTWHSEASAMLQMLLCIVSW